MYESDYWLLDAYSNLTIERLTNERDAAIERAERAEARIEEALTFLDEQSKHSWRRDRVGQLIEGLGCRLTGRKSSWWTGVR